SIVHTAHLLLLSNMPLFLAHQVSGQTPLKYPFAESNRQSDQEMQPGFLLGKHSRCPILNHFHVYNTVVPFHLRDVPSTSTVLLFRYLKKWNEIFFLHKTKNSSSPSRGMPMHESEA